MMAESQLNNEYVPLMAPPPQQQLPNPPSYNAIPYQQGGAPWQPPQHSQATMNQLPAPAPHYYENPPPAEKNNHDAHVYFALAMILSVMFLFTGIGILTMICLLPAIVYARQAANRRRPLNVYDEDYAGTALCCIMTGCFFGSLGVLAIVGFLIFSFITGFWWCYYCD